MFWHKHRWKATGVHHMYEVRPYLPDIKKPVTEVLMVCDCRVLKTILLTGHWTLEQLQPAQPAAREIDREFLRRMGVKS